MNKGKRSILVLLLGMLILASCGNSNRGEADEKPNVLFIAVDDLNTWIGCLNGYSNTRTPNMDDLASRGVLFSNAHCQAPLCGPSRASLMSGLRPSSTGIYGMIHDDRIRSDNPATKNIIFLPEYFRDHGYHTMGIGKLFHTHAPEGVFDESGGRVKGFGPLPEERFVWDGFGTSDRENYGRTSTDWGAFPEADSLMPDHQSVDWVIERLKRKQNKPFFLGLGFLRPHVPLYVPQKWFDMHPLEGIEVAPYKADDLDDVPPLAFKINDLPMMPSTEWAIENGEWKNIIQAYLACVSFVDYEIGRVLEALEKSEYADNTVIVLWSDHGYRLGEKGTFAKHALWETATNAPLIFVAPNLPEGKVIDSPAEMLSIYPTLLELCGLPDYERNEGISLVSTMQGLPSDEDASAICTFGMNNHGIKSKGYRYIRYEDGGEELYDHRSDPNEWTNQANNPAYEDALEALKNLLPETNAYWDKNSSYTFQPYFVEQKERTTALKKTSQASIVEEILVDSVWAANGVGFDLKTVGNKQFVAYFDQNRMMSVASREIGSDEWTKKILPNQLMWDSHNSVRMGIDEMGYIHVSGNMHVHPLAYFRSKKPFDVRSMVEVNEMLGKDEEHLTYPKFFHDKSGSLFYSYRAGTCGNGNILVNRYLPGEERWERFLSESLFEGIEENDDRAAYHHWVKDSKGNFHFTWIWRWTPDVETSHQICYATTPDLKNWKNAAGETISLPFRPDDERVIVDGTPSKGGMHNSRYKLILNEEDEPFIGYVKYDEEGLTQFYLAKYSDGNWISRKISDWDFRWKFVDGGAFMTMGGSFHFAGISDDGLLAIDWKTEKGESGRYTIDLETLEHSDKTAEISRRYPQDLGSNMTDIPGMSVRMAYDKGGDREDGSSYVIKWETLHGGFAQHAPEVIPDGPLSPLVLLKIK